MKKSEIIKEDFNSEDVMFCTRCLSLKIVGDDQICFCDNCSGTNISTTNIFEWEKMYINKYNKKYIIKNEERRKKTYL